jgi:hypothetical protein
VAAAAAASAAQATAQQAFDAKTAAAATALKAATDAQDNATREAASFAALSGGPTTEGTTEIPETDVQPPTYLHSDNVTLVNHVRGLYSTSTAGKTCPAYNPTKCPGYSSLNFLHYDNLGYDVMVANGTAGLSVWSLKDPANPKWIGQVTVDDLKNGTKPDPTDPAKTVPIIPDGSSLTQFWEGENMTVDSRRKLAFMSRDSGTKGQIIIDLKDPWHPKLLNFSKNYQGHTSTCLNDCRFMWSVGGTSGAPAPAKASPVSVTDMRDALHPFVYPALFGADIDRTGVNPKGSGTHSVDVDFDGVVWVSGQDGSRGFYTEGLHKDPATGQDRYATPYNPIPYAGGRVGGGSDASFMHNAYHVPTAIGGRPAGDVMLITNESNDTSCATAGKFVIASLSGMYDGTDNPTSASRMTRLAAYSTSGKPGEFHSSYPGVDRNGKPVDMPLGDCSAHWFTVKGNIVALGNYEQGTRFVDISDPTNPQQVGWFRVPAQAAVPGVSPEILSSDTAGSYWHGKYVYIADYQRGIDIIKLDDSANRGKIQPTACWNSCERAGQTVDPMTTSTPGSAGGTVSATLALTLGTQATFGAFTPGLAKDYTSQATATVTSTAGDGALGVADPSATATGHLVNGTFSLPSVLQAKASSAAGTGSAAYANVGSSAAPTPLLTYAGPTSNDAVTVGFSQHIGAGDALRTGAYSKTLTFTLSTTTP